jgi:GxxExxY protein
MKRTAEEIDSLSENVIGCAIAVHRTLGPGLLESIYRECMIIELRLAGLRVVGEQPVHIEYRGRRVANALKVDLLDEDGLIIELKAVDRIHPVHLAQVITYLKLTGCPAGLLLNFNATTLKAGLRRVYHPDKYIKRTS